MIQIPDSKRKGSSARDLEGEPLRVDLFLELGNDIAFIIDEPAGKWKEPGIFPAGTFCETKISAASFSGS